MELSKIVIKNFRSIKEEEITFGQNCQILLGKNEAGKSNIIKAIAAVFGLYPVSDKDKRKRIDNEKIDEYYTRAVITLSEDDIKQVLSTFNKKFTNSNIVRFQNGFNTESFIRSAFNSFLIQIDIGNDKKPYSTYWNFEKKGWELKELLFVKNLTISTQQLVGNIALNIGVEIFNIIKELYQIKPICCHYWLYKDDYLLPNSVSISSFISDPKSVKGLENIFILCNRENIKKEFEDAYSQDGDYSNLLEQVSITVSKTFQKIWKDFKGTNIQLLHNGDEILIKVVDKAKYSFEDRSDGFKKFISILLMLSTPSRAKKILDRDIILIDEPDQSLYPTSAQYLRDELLEIGKSSKIIFSTHSQYMIDPNCLDRHLIVEKKDDITTIHKESGISPFSNDELLRRAIGASIFECIKPKNIIFEGYLDKELFQKYITFNKMNTTFKDYGMVFLSGISGVETLAQVLILANKKFLIVADSDDASRSKKNDFFKNYNDYKNCWLSYGDVCTGISTMEDFFEVPYVENQIKEYGVSGYVYEVSKNVIFNIEKAVEKIKDQKQDIKNNLIKNLDKKELIKSDYDDFIKKIKEKLDNL